MICLQEMDTITLQRSVAKRISHSVQPSLSYISKLMIILLGPFQLLFKVR